MPQPEYTWAHRRESLWCWLKSINKAAVINKEEMEGCLRLISSPSWFHSNLKTLSWHRSKSDLRTASSQVLQGLKMLNKHGPPASLKEDKARSSNLPHYNKFRCRDWLICQVILGIFGVRARNSTRRSKLLFVLVAFHHWHWKGRTLSYTDCLGHEKTKTEILFAYS